MPRRAPGALRRPGPGGVRGGTVNTGRTVSTLMISTCPGPPGCSAPHSYVFVDGLDMISRSDSRMLGLPPRLLLRPGGPLHPADFPRTVGVATYEDPLPEDGPGDEPGPEELRIRVHLRGQTVVWTGLMYPGLEDGPTEEARFGLGQYFAEIHRARACMSGRPG